MCSTKLVLVAGLCLMLAACGGKPGVSEAQKAYARGYDCLMKEKNWESAQLQFEKVVRLEPENRKAWFYLGVAYQRSGNFDNSVRCLKTAEEKSRANGDAQFLALSLSYLGTVHHRQGEYAEAARYYELNLVAARALGTARPIAEALNNYAWLLATARAEAVRDGHRALPMAQEAVKLAGRTGDEEMISRNNATLAAAYAELDDFDQAVKVLEQVIARLRKIPRPTLLYEQRLKMYKQKEKYRE